MVIIRLILLCILAVAVIPVSGCKTKTTSKEKSKKTADKAVDLTKSGDEDINLLKSAYKAESKKLTVVSKAFLAPEAEQMRLSTHESTVEFAKDGVGIAYIEPFNGQLRVIHNGQAGKPYVQITELLISSDGKRFAYVAIASDKLNKIVVDGKEGAVYGASDSHRFTPDGKHHIATVTEGDDRYIVIDNKIIRNYRIERGPVVSSDSRAIAFSVKSPDGNNKQIIVTDMKGQKTAVVDDCGEFFVPSDDSSVLAAGCWKDDANQSVKLIDFKTRSVISERKIDGALKHLRVAPDNRSLLYTLLRKHDRYVVYNNREEKTPDGDEFFLPPVVLSSPNGVGVIIGTVYKAYLYRAFQRQNKIGKGYGYISDLIASRDGRHNAYVATKAEEHQMQIVIDGREGPKFDKIVSPVFSPDGRYLVYRARQAGKRFLVVSDTKEKIVSRHKDYAMVFQPSFTSDGKSVAYGVLDGNEFWWKVEKLEK